MSIDQSIYRQRFHKEDLSKNIAVWQVLAKHWFPKFVSAESVTLDLGAGACGFINTIASKEKIAIDHNPDVKRSAREDVRCIVDELLQGLKQIPSDGIDTIMASNVFEHLPNKEYFFECLAQAYRVLRPGGKLIVMQPNFRAVKERFYDFPDHCLPLTEKGMAEALAASGFTIEYVKGRFLPYTTKSRYPKWPFLVRLYLLFPIAHRFMGGQMFIIGSKPVSRHTC